MKPEFDPEKHHRRSIRLKGWDYASEGAYFVTMVTQGRECLLGEIVDKEMHLNTYGEIVLRWWYEISNHFPNVELGAFVIMPNHVHGIIFIHQKRRGEVISPRNHPNNDFHDEIVHEDVISPRNHPNNDFHDEIVHEDVISPRGNPNNDVQNINVGEIENPGGESLNPGVENQNPGGEIPNPGFENQIPGEESLNPGVKTSNPGGRTPPLRKPTLGQIVAYFKYQSTKEMNRIETEYAITKFWQRNYYEHIIRDEKDLQQKTDYILGNPLRWDEDDENIVRSN